MHFLAFCHSLSTLRLMREFTSVRIMVKKNALVIIKNRLNINPETQIF